MKRKDVYKRALLLAVPMMIQNGITNAVGLVDNVMVGSLGTEAMTAVSIVGQLIFVFNLAIFGGLSGPGIYGAQFFGQKNTEGFRNAFRMKHWICAFCVLGGIAIFLLLDEFLIGLYLQGESEQVDPVLTMKLAKEYLSIMLCGLLPFAITQIYASSLRETGDSIKPMAAGIASVVIDVVFNYLLIYGKFGMPALGVKGAAIATVLARIVEMCVVVIWAFARKQKHEFLQGIYRTILVPRDLTGKILIKGVPIFFNEFLWAGGLAALTQSYSVRGLEIVAGMNISNAICNLMNVVFVALGSAVGILVGQKLGASEYEDAEKDAFSLMWFSGGITLILTAILISISGVFPFFYDTTQEIRNYGTVFIIITALFFPVQAFLNALYFTLRSGGKTLITFLFDSVYSWVIPVPMAFLLCRFTDLPILAIFVMVQAADLIKVAVGYILIRKRVWISNLVA
ncbi:MAG: MATE family efflux transporter [Oscillospiraceae bacterium]|nr:MATE family efflux transporter [Oscillospiraceae bacterium]